MRTSLKAAATGTVATMVLSGAVLAGTTGAQASHEGRQLTGTWRVVVDPDPTPAGDQPPFASTIAYTSTGSVIETTSRALSSAGLGTWGRTGTGEFTSTVEKYRFDSAGNYAGRTRIIEVQRVAEDGESYSARATTEIINPAGAVVATFTSVARGARM